MSRSLSDIVLQLLLYAAATLTGVLVLVILYYLMRESAPVLHRVGCWRFFSDAAWHPTDGQFNFTPMLWGTIYATLGSVVLATPLGILSAIFCLFYAPPFIAKIYRAMVEVMAGIPSVVYGFWGLVVLVPLLTEKHPPGTSLLIGIVILTMMILPTVTLVSMASLGNVPSSQTQAAAALGLSRSATIYRVIIPAAKSGIVTSVILATGRALGETMAVLMVSGNVVQIPHSLFDPMRTLSANIALEMAYAMGNHRSALFVSAVVLLTLVLALVLLSEILSQRKIYGEY